ncbi:hypothetical protein ACE6H2_006676 [Prunus campanulata]
MQHSRTNSCDLLAQLRSSLSLDSGFCWKEMGPEFWFQVQRVDIELFISKDSLKTNK